MLQLREPVQRDTYKQIARAKGMQGEERIGAAVVIHGDERAALVLVQFLFPIEQVVESHMILAGTK